MIRAALAAMRSPFYRREMWNYVKWVLRNRCACAAARQFAKGFSECKPSRKYPAWATGPDPEIALKRHRFEWTERPVIDSEANALIVLEQICDWIDKYPPGKDAEGWDVYSASRRAANWILVLSVMDGFMGAYAPLRSVQASLARHADFIADNLEFRGDATNNHLLANATALYTVGSHLKIDRHAAKGREIVLHCIREMFTAEGFLRENSTHYHLLACRLFVEIAASARDAEDKTFGGVVCNHLAKMFHCAAFLRESIPMPAFGDVSPDIDPASVLKYLDRFMAQTPEMDRLRAAAFPQSGYYRMRNERWKIVFHANLAGHVPPGSHGHDDLLSFNLYHDGRPVLSDPGNSTYEDGPMGRFWRSFRAHNTLSIDGLGPSVVHAHNAHAPLLLPCYFGTPPSIRGGYNGEFVGIEIGCAGFGRISPGMEVTRGIFVAKNHVIIDDSIGGSGRHRAEWFFHFHPSIDIRSGEFSLEPYENAGSKMRRQRFGGAGGRNPMGWHSRSYGNCVPSDSIVFSEHIRLPAQRRFVLQRME